MNKTPSQRLRAVIYRLWEQSGKQGGRPKLDQDEYYEIIMEKLIEQLKSKLGDN